MPRRLSVLLSVLAVALAGCGSSAATHSHARTAASSMGSTASTPAASSGTSTQRSSGGTQMGFENVPIETGAAIAPASTTGRGKVDGISCAPIEQLAYHIHAHLAVFVNGASRALPGGIGIPGSQVEQTTEGPVAIPGQGSCYYWLHTHAPDGVIHIESPTKRIYTLGDFFDVWRQPLTRTRIGTIAGTQSWYVDGRPWTRDPRDIRLLPHTVIQLSVGQPVVPYQSVDWARTGL